MFALPTDFRWLPPWQPIEDKSVALRGRQCVTDFNTRMQGGTAGTIGDTIADELTPQHYIQKGKTEMKRSALALTLVALLCSGSLAQERETRTREGQRRGERDRREYGRGRLGVEDPAGFKTEGEQIFSGPQPGEKLPAFKATSLDGDKKGKELDPHHVGRRQTTSPVFSGCES